MEFFDTLIGLAGFALAALLRFVFGTWMGWLLILVLVWTAVSDRVLGDQKRRLAARVGRRRAKAGR